MIITINKSTPKEKVEQILAKIKGRKKFRAKKHLGKFLFPFDGLSFQKKVRNEWE